MLRLLDEHLIALIEEVGTSERTDEWVQERSAEVIDLLVGATTIEPDDLEFIRDAILARAKFVTEGISQRQRRQDYLLGLPIEDCEEIRANRDSLLIWYQGCADIFARRLDAGIGMLIQLLNFVSSLSICPKKWRSKQPEPLPMFGQTIPDAETANRSALFKDWILGEDTRGVARILKQLKPDVDFSEYREDMLERNLAWGISAIGRFLNTIAEEKRIPLTKDLEFLPSLIKYGVPSKLACFLVRQMIPREAATRIAELYIDRINSDEDVLEEFNQSTFAYAEMAVKSLTEDDIATLHLDEDVVRRIREIIAHGLAQVQ